MRPSHMQVALCIALYLSVFRLSPSFLVGNGKSRMEVHGRGLEFGVTFPYMARVTIAVISRSRGQKPVTRPRKAQAQNAP